MTAGATDFVMSSAPYNTEATVFLPGNAIAKEEFPDLDQAYSAPQKKKKGPTKEEIEAQKKAAIEALTTKGKPESFFYYQDQFGNTVPPTLEQMQFVWSYYPNYSAEPLNILYWLIGEARRIAEEEEQAK